MSKEAIATPAASATPGEDSGLPISSLTELSSAERAVLAGWKKPAPGATSETSDAETPSDQAEDDEDQKTEESTDATETEEASATEEEETTEEEKSEDEEEKEEESEEEEAKGVQKRINQLHAQKAKAREERDEAIAERDALKEQLQALTERLTTKPLALMPTPEDPLAELTTEDQIEARMEKARATIQWCKANRKGAEVPRAEGSDEMVELDPDQIQAIREQEEEVLNEHAPRRKEYIQAFATATANAREAYPTLFKSGHKDQAYATAVMKMIPGFARHPFHELFIGDMLLGAQVRLGKAVVVRKDEKATPPAVVKKAPVKSPLSASATTPATKQAGSKPDTSALKAKAFTSGSQADVEKLFEAKFG